MGGDDEASKQRCLATAVLGAGLVCLVVSPAFAQGTPLRDAYFGETHVHTSWSLDAWMMGNRTTYPSWNAMRGALRLMRLEMAAYWFIERLAGFAV
jgi:hypothetical protein